MAQIDDNKVVIKKGESPIAWSEEGEDRAIISDLLDYFDEGKCLKHEVNDIVKWLKTIKPQQKRGWGENEIKMLNNLITYLDGRKDLLEEIKSTYIDWLKSLKGRVLPQPKQEWSEEDNYVFNEILKRVADKKLYEHDLEYIYKWLKSLKDRAIRK